MSTWTRADTTDGITWKVPPKWVNMPERPMRARTYAIPSPTGDEQPSECVVYYFNQGLSASKQANIERWCNQFEQPDGRNSLDVAKIEEMTVNDLAVTIVDLMGNYKMAAGPMMQVEDIRPGYRMIGAILEGPAGTVFFKMVGPQETISASKEDFMGLVSSAQKVAM